MQFQVIQLAVSIMKTLKRTHTNKGHRDTNEQTPKTSNKRESVMEMRETVRQRTARSSSAEWERTKRKMAWKLREMCILQEQHPECGPFVSPSRFRIDVHHSGRRQVLILHLWEGHQIRMSEKKDSDTHHLLR